MGRLTRKLFLFVLLFFVTGVAFGEINFSAIQKERIDLKKLEIEKQQFFDFVAEKVNSKRKGLGLYGRVSFIPCSIKVDGVELSSYKNLKGRDVKYLSNPSCGQLVLGKVLKKGYGYDSGKLSTYGNRQCLLTIEKIFSPILEYYTILYEERAKKSCSNCDFAEKKRLSKIGKIQSKIEDSCGSEYSKVDAFLAELGLVIEKAFKEKSGK